MTKSDYLSRVQNNKRITELESVIPILERNLALKNRKSADYEIINLSLWELKVEYEERKRRKY